MTHGRSLELFFIDGKPDGMLTAEIYDWPGRILMTPRTRIKEAFKRKDLAHRLFCRPCREVLDF